MWYSVTPESIANHVAERMVNIIRDGGRPASDENNNGNKTGNENNVRDIVIIDAFCGCEHTPRNTKEDLNKPRLESIAPVGTDVDRRNIEH